MLYYSGCRNLTSPWTTPTILTSIDYDNDHEFHISSQYVNDIKLDSTPLCLSADLLHQHHFASGIRPTFQHVVQTMRREYAWSHNKNHVTVPIIQSHNITSLT